MSSIPYKFNKTKHKHILIGDKDYIIDTIKGDKKGRIIIDVFDIETYNKKSYLVDSLIDLQLPPKKTFIQKVKDFIFNNKIISQYKS